MSDNYVVLEYTEFKKMMDDARTNIKLADGIYDDLQSKLKEEIVGKTFFTRRPISKWKNYLNKTDQYFNGIYEVLYNNGELSRAEYLCLIYGWSVECLEGMLSDHSVKNIHLNERDFNRLNIVSTRKISNEH